MDEEKKVASTEETSPEPIVEKENVASEEADTQPTSEADVKEVSGEDKVDTPDSKWKNEKKSMSGKISKLEKDNNEYLRKVRLLDALNNAAVGDSEFMRAANKKLVEQGVLDESALEQIQATPQSKTDGVTVNPAVKWAEAKMREETQKREEFFTSFEDNHPDLKEGETAIIKANRSAIGAAATKRMVEDKIPMEDAYEFAYKLIMDPKQLIEEGKLQGIAQAQSASPVEGAASGGVANSSGGVKLTPEQKEAATLFGITEEEYAKNL